MDVIQIGRQLGKAMHEDERFSDYNLAKERNDNDEELQNLIGEFNLKRQQLGLEMSKGADEKDEAKIEEANKEMQRLYTLIMQNEHMADFTMAKQGMDKLVNDINAIIGMCCDGEDPDTCEISACTGSCATCGGCH